MSTSTIATDVTSDTQSPLDLSTIAKDIANTTGTKSDRQAVQQLIDDGTFLKIAAEYKLCKLLEREKEGYLRVLHRRVGAGLSVAEFGAIVKKLTSLGFCSFDEGKRGAEMLTLNEHSTNLAREVCKPVSYRVFDDDPTDKVTE